MTYILDTSAIIAFLGDEKGGRKVEGFKKDAAIPFMAMTELYYVVWRKKGKSVADTVYGIVKGWQIPVLMPDEKVMLTAGRFKIKYNLGIADSFIAAFAFNGKCRLVTKDPDFTPLREEIDLLYLDKEE